MNAVVTGPDGQALPVEHWGNLDFTGIKMWLYPRLDLTDTVMVSGGVTGPCFVRVGDDIIDLKTRMSAKKPTSPAVGYCPRQAEIDEHVRLAHELSAQR